MRPTTTGASRLRRWALRRCRGVAAVALLCALSATSVAGVRYSLALFADSESASTTLDSRDIFSGERVTPAFAVADWSSGGFVDGSSPLAFASDARAVTTSPAAAGFEPDRYLELSFNRPLPGGLRISPASLTLRLASTGPAATACYHLEVRRTSTAEVLSAYGSATSPAGCVTGTGFVSGTAALPVVDSSDLANDLTVRVMVRDSAASGLVLDQAVITGSTVTAPFTLYPVLFVDAADGAPVTTPWELSAR